MNIYRITLPDGISTIILTTSEPQARFKCRRKYGVAPIDIRLSTASTAANKAIEKNLHWWLLGLGLPYGLFGAYFMGWL